MDKETYLQKRVADQLDFYEKAANKAKRHHVYVQSTIIILGLLVPVVVNLPTKWGDTFDGSIVIRIIVTILSLLLASLTGIANFRKYGELWLSYRMTEELIKNEKYLFLTSSARYVNQETAFSIFVQTVESIISSEHNKFRSIIEEAKRPAKDQSQVPPNNETDPE